MSTPETGRAYLQFIAAVCYFFLAQTLARHGAQGVASEALTPLVEQAMLVFLLLLGYAAFGSWMDHQSRPISAQGLPRREGWLGEAGLGLVRGLGHCCGVRAAHGAGGRHRDCAQLQPSAWGWLLADAAFFALAALAKRSPFAATDSSALPTRWGRLGAVAGVCGLLCHCAGSWRQGRSHASVAVSVMLSLLLSTAYCAPGAVGELGHQLRLEGQPGAAVRARRERRQQPFARGAGRPDGAVLAHRRRLRAGRNLDCVRGDLAAAFPVVYRLTRELDFRYNAPVIVPGGIPVDLDAAARRQHEAATRAGGARAPALVQILPVAPPPSRVPPPPPSGRPDISLLL
jgi:hypothetical protein